MNIFDVVTKSVEWLGNKFTNEDKDSINSFRSQLTVLSDQELQARLHGATEGVSQAKEGIPPQGNILVPGISTEVR